MSLSYLYYMQNQKTSRPIRTSGNNDTESVKKILQTKNFKLDLINESSDYNLEKKESEEAVITL